MAKCLVGNTFPLTLVRRECVIKPISFDDALARLAGGVASFWGHTNTLAAAKQQLGVDVSPATERPALKLDDNGLPSLDGAVYKEVLVLSPSYAPGFRPQVGVEVKAEEILGWEPLLVSFPAP